MNNPVDEGTRAEADYRRRLADDLLLFAEELVIPSSSGPQTFRDCMADFQRECFAELAPSLRAVRDGTMPPMRRFWVERTKKAGKDSDLAICLMWLVAFVERPFLVQVSAANRKQAGIVKRRIKDILFYNPWLQELLFVQLNRVLSTDRTAEIVIEATGSAGAAHGETPDVLVLNELVHVDRWEVNEAHMNNADGVPRGIVLVFTNAGIKGTPAELWKNNAEAHPERWAVKRWKGLAPWLNVEDVEEAKRLDPIGTQYKRLWLGLWQSGKGDALTEASIDRCFRVDGPIKGPKPGWQYVASLDLGVVHDHSGVVLVGVNPEEQRLRVGIAKGWTPDTMNEQTGRLEVSGDEVERYCLWLHKCFHTVWFGYDPAEGGRFLAQELRSKGLPMVQINFSSQKETGDMAEALVQVVKSGRLECYEDKEGRLRRDLGKFSLVPKPRSLGGYKLEAVSDEWGHADVGMALVMCLPKALELLEGYSIFSEDDVLAIPAMRGDEPTSDELEDMPEELREIYEDAGIPPRDWDDDGW